MQAASRSWTLLLVALRKLSTSASTPRMEREAVHWSNAGGLVDPGAGDRCVPGGCRECFLPVVFQTVTDNLNEGEPLQDRALLDDGLDDSLQEDIGRELGWLRLVVMDHVSYVPPFCLIPAAIFSLGDKPSRDISPLGGAPAGTLACLAWASRLALTAVAMDRALATVASISSMVAPVMTSGGMVGLAALVISRYFDTALV